MPDLLNFTATSRHVINRLDEDGIALFVKTPAGVYEAINESGARMLSKTASAVVGLSDSEHFDEASAQLMQARDRAALASDKCVEFDSVVKTGQRWLRFKTAKVGVDLGLQRRLLLGISILGERRADFENRASYRDAIQLINANPRAFVQAIFSERVRVRCRQHWSLSV